MRDQPPPDSRCINHEDRDATGKCSECGAYICNKCGFFDGTKIVCKDCIAKRFGANRWEENFAGGGIKGFFITLWRVVISPSRFFLSVSKSKAIASAILFAIICEFIGTLGVVLTSNPNETFSLFLGVELLPEVVKNINIAILLVTPLLTILSIVILALIYQGLAVLFGGKGEFRATLKVVAYASIASLVQFIPWIGGYLSLFYTLILYTKGISQVHKLSGLRAGAVAVLPIMAFLLLVSIVGTIFISSLSGGMANIFN